MIQDRNKKYTDNSLFGEDMMHKFSRLCGEIIHRNQIETTDLPFTDV